MYPGRKDQDSARSTGVYYQTEPAVGVDGKNIMKLIPVQMVDGRFHQTATSKPRAISAPQRAAAVNTASAPAQLVKKTALIPFATRQTVKKVSSLSSLFNPVELDHGYSLNKKSLQQQTVNLTAAEAPTATPATNCGNSVKRPCRLPVTVKSPALPTGHYLQIPPNAQVRSVPASELPSGIKEQIFLSSDNSSSGSSLQSVVYISPVVAVKQGVAPPSDSTLDSLRRFSETSNRTSCGSLSKGSKPLLKLIPKVSKRPGSPIKWVIEEDSSTAPNLNPLNSSVTSEILRAVAKRETAGKDRASGNLQTVAKRENASKRCDFIEKSHADTSEILQVLAERGTAGEHSDVISPGKGGEGEVNALVVCDGRVFFLARKCNLPFKISQSDSTAAVKGNELIRTTLPSSQQPVKPVVAQTRQDLRIIIPDESDDVIDLCGDDDDDDDDDDSTQQASVDEDNVIFVSYIPPKSGSTNDSMQRTQVALEKETEWLDTSSSNCVTCEKGPDGRTGGDDGDESFACRGLRRVCDSAVTNAHQDLNVKSTATQLAESMEADAETKSPADPSTSDRSRGTRCQQEDIDKVQISHNPATCWKSSPAPKPCLMADRLLRQIFGITNNVRICLQRIDEASAWSECMSSVEGHQKATNRLQGLYGSCRKQHTDNHSDVMEIKRVKLLNELGFSADPAALPPHADLALNNKCHSGESPRGGLSCDVGTESMVGYVEPIDEDFPSSDENNVPTFHHTTAQPKTQTRRIGRMRKRTMCPCCAAASLGPAVKSNARLEEPEKWA